MLVALCSLKGSPGVTTTTVALATRWPNTHTPVLVECDPAGGDLGARFCLPGTTSLVSLAAAARRSSDASVLWQHIHRFGGEVSVIPGPVNAEQAGAALTILASHRTSVLRAAADQPGVVVVADCGRVNPDSPALPIIRAADVMVLLARAHDDELSHVAAKTRVAATWNQRPGFVLVGDGYTTGAIKRELNIDVLARLPHDPKGAAVFSGRRRSPGPERSPLGRAALRLARGLTTATQDDHAAMAAWSGTDERPTGPAPPPQQVTTQRLTPRSFTDPFSHPIGVDRDHRTE